MSTDMVTQTKYSKKEYMKWIFGDNGIREDISPPPILKRSDIIECTHCGKECGCTFLCDDHSDLTFKDMNEGTCGPCINKCGNRGYTQLNNCCIDCSEDPWIPIWTISPYIQARPPLGIFCDKCGFRLKKGENICCNDCRDHFYPIEDVEERESDYQELDFNRLDF
jgi:hypothetical protein